MVAHFAGLLEYGCYHASYTEPAVSTILAQVMKLLYTSVPLHSSEDNLGLISILKALKKLCSSYLNTDLSSLLPWC